MVDFVRESTGATKVQYMGFSNGTAQYFYGAANAGSRQWYADNISHAAMLSPCTKITGASRSSLASILLDYDYLRDSLYSADVWHIGGDNFYDQLDVKLACFVEPDFCTLAESFINGYESAFGVRLVSHYAQTAITDRFQEYNRDFEFGFVEATPEQRMTAEIPIDSIQVPISMYVAKQDDLCPLATGQWAY